jgi:chemotaxis protein methyltransferase CheR
MTAAKGKTAVSGSDPVLLFLERRVEEILGIKAAPDALLKLKESLEEGRGSFPVGIETYGKLFSTAEGIAAAARIVTINETYFFRESIHFKLLSRCFLPLFAKWPRTIRICSAASSTGCEAYSLAMLMDFYSRGKELFPPVSDISSSVRGIPFIYAIDAFDVNPEVINYARDGRYTTNTLREDGAEWRPILDLYLKPDGKKYRIEPFLRDKVNFFTHNIMDGIKGPYDLIFFRNALIYFSQENRLKILDSLVNALTAGGFLVLGVSETSSIEHPDLENIVLPGVFYFQKKTAVHRTKYENKPAVIGEEPPAVKFSTITPAAEKQKTALSRPNLPDTGMRQKRSSPAAEKIAQMVERGDPPNGKDLQRSKTAGHAAQPDMKEITALLEHEDGRSNMTHVTKFLEQHEGTAKATESELIAAAVSFLGAEDFSPADKVILVLEKTSDSAAVSFLRGEYHYLSNDVKAAEEKYREASLKDHAFWPAFYRLSSLAAEGNRTRYEYKIKKALESMDAGKEFHYEAYIGGFSPDYYQRILKRKLTE